MLKKITLNQVYTLLLVIIVFLIPSNLFLKFNESSAYVNGLLVDYLLPKFYLSDVFILGLLILWLIETISVKQFTFKLNQINHWLVLVLLFLAGRQIFTSYPMAAGWYLVKLFEIGGLAFFLASHHKLLTKLPITSALTTGICFQSILAIFQFKTQASLFGYSLLGEPNLAHSIGLAKDGWWGTGRVLPYGTTAHPNILAGILAIFSLILIGQLPGNKWLRRLAIFSVTLAVYVIGLTQSISAMSILMIGLLLIKFHAQVKQKMILMGSLILLVITPLVINWGSQQLPQSQSLYRRAYLQKAALRMTLNHPLLGVGLNQFTAQVEDYSTNPEITRFVQPVHHVGLLWLSETGLIGLVLLGLISRIKSKKLAAPIAILLPLISLDHYLITQQSGLLLAVFAFYFLYNQSYVRAH